MARHRHSPSPARSTVYHQDQCRHSATLRSVSHSKCTCSRTDFIPSWLQHVQTSYNDTSREILRQASPGPQETSWHPNGIPTVRIQSSYDAGRYQSSDLLIQDTPSPSTLAGQTSRHCHHESDPNSDYGKDLDGRKGYYHSKPHVSTPPGASIVEQDAFEKQPRRKTRKDRYNTIRLKDVRTGKQQAKRSSTRVSKNGKLRSSREIMANFKSSAITNPNERVTLKPNFTPGLFVNGRSSAPLADLVFNDIPSPSESDKPIDSEPLSNPTSRKPKGDVHHQDEIDFLSKSSRGLKEVYLPPESSNPNNGRATSIASSYDFQSVQRSINTDNIDDGTAAGRADTIPRHGNSAGDGVKDNGGDNHRPSPQHDSYTLHIRSIYSFSPTTDPYVSGLDMLNKPLPPDANSMQGVQRESAARHQGLITGASNNERSLGSCNPTKPVEYEDKGVMVSPWMYQRTEKHESGGKNGDNNNRLWPNAGDRSNSRAELHSPNTFPQMLPHKGNQQDRLPQSKGPGIGTANIESQIYGYPTYLPHVSERLQLTTEIKDIRRPHSDSSPAWFYGTHSTHYPLHPYPNSGLSSVGDFEWSKILNTHSRDACSVDMPAQLANSDQGFQLSRETCQDSRLCSDALHAIDDIPGESLKEYIERMEREILGSTEPSTPSIDDALLSAQDVYQSQIPGVPHTDAFTDARCSNHHLRGIEPKDDLSPRKQVQQPIREELCWPSGQYQRLPYPGESLNRELESELASFLQPNHMMWC